MIKSIITLELKKNQIIQYLVFVFFLLVLKNNNTFGQLKEKKLIDSLQNLINYYSTDTVNIRNLCKLSDASFILQYDRGIVYGQTALKLASKINNTELMAWAHEAIGRNYWGKSDYPLSLIHHSESLKLYSTAKNTYGMINANRNIAVVSFSQNKLDAAENYFITAINLANNSLRDTVLIAGDNGLLQGLAMTFLALGKLDKQIETLQKADLMLIKARLFNKRCGILQLIAEFWKNKGDYIKAMYFTEQAFQIAIKNNDHLAAGKSLDQISYLYTQQKQWTKALESSRKALSQFSEIDEKGHIARTHADLGKINIDLYRQLKKNKQYLEQAIHHLSEALRIARPISSLVVLQEYEYSLSEAYELMGNYKMALISYKKHRDYLDSLQSTQKENKFHLQLLELEYQKKRDSLDWIKKFQSEKLKTLEKNNELKSAQIKQMWTAVVSFILLCMGLIWIMIQRKKNQIRLIHLQNEKEKMNLLHEENNLQQKINALSVKALHTQLNPHFIFNCLNSIKLYIEDNRKENATYYLSQFSILIRKILDATSREYICLADELELLFLYLDMESMRLKEKLEWRINTDNSIDTETTELPAMLLQPFVENAIWHGIMPMEGKGKVEIITKRISNNIIEVKIVDNGIGINQSLAFKKQKKEIHQSKGIDLIRERVRLFAEKKHMIASIEIIDRSELIDQGKSGTEVIITLENENDLNTKTAFFH